jgi:hypothetical protein
VLAGITVRILIAQVLLEKIGGNNCHCCQPFAVYRFMGVAEGPFRCIFRSRNNLFATKSGTCLKRKMPSGTLRTLQGLTYFIANLPSNICEHCIFDRSAPGMSFSMIYSTQDESDIEDRFRGSNGRLISFFDSKRLCTDMQSKRSSVLRLRLERTLSEIKNKWSSLLE